MAVLIGAVPLLRAARRRTPEAITLWALIALPAAGLVLARIASLAAPTWVSRYFGPLTVALLLLGALSAARARVVGVAAIVLCVGFLANPGSFTPAFKSDMRDVAGEIGPLLHPGDLVVDAQPEQTPLAWYYLPAGLGFANTLGPVSDPTYMNWRDAQARLQDANPARRSDRSLLVSSPASSCYSCARSPKGCRIGSSHGPSSLGGAPLSGVRS